MVDTYAHLFLPLISRAQTCIHLGASLLLALPESLPLHTQTRDLSDDGRHTPMPMPTLDC